MDEMSKAVELNEILEDLEPMERVEVFKLVHEGYCRDCGELLPCYDCNEPQDEYTRE